MKRLWNAVIALAVIAGLMVGYSALVRRESRAYVQKQDFVQKVEAKQLLRGHGLVVQTKPTGIWQVSFVKEMLERHGAELQPNGGIELSFVLRKSATGDRYWFDLTVRCAGKQPFEDTIASNAELGELGSLRVKLAHWVSKNFDEKK